MIRTRPLLQMKGDWPEFLSKDPALEELHVLRRHESTGRPLGNDTLIQPLEQASRRILRRRKFGPKCKVKDN